MSEPAPGLRPAAPGPAAPGPAAPGPAADGISLDLWLGGRLVLAQPRAGHRVGSDAALLAAAAPDAASRIVDVGAGVGAVGLAMLATRARAVADLIEIDAALADLAAGNAERNGLADRARVVRADVFDAGQRRLAGIADEAADLVLTNPPFFAAGAVRPPADPGKARAYAFGAERGPAPLHGWIRAALALLSPNGTFVMIHRPDALPAILMAAENRLGALALLPVHPRAGTAAHRLLVMGRKGSKAPLRIVPGLVLHGADGRLTPEADAIHRGERRLDWGD